MALRISVIAAILGTAVFAQAPEGDRTTVAGTVVNAVSGAPIPGASVIANLTRRFSPGQGRASQAYSQRAVTDASGSFSFETGGAVSGALQISHQGYYSEAN